MNHTIPVDLFEAYRSVLLAADKATRGTPPGGVSRSAWAQLRRAVQAAHMAQNRARQAGVDLRPGEKPLQEGCAVFLRHRPNGGRGRVSQITTIHSSAGSVERALVKWETDGGEQWVDSEKLIVEDEEEV